MAARVRLLNVLHGIEGSIQHLDLSAVQNIGSGGSRAGRLSGSLRGCRSRDHRRLGPPNQVIKGGRRRRQ